MGDAQPSMAKAHHGMFRVPYNVISIFAFDWQDASSVQLPSQRKVAVDCKPKLATECHFQLHRPLASLLRTSSVNFNDSTPNNFKLKCNQQDVKMQCWAALIDDSLPDLVAEAFGVEALHPLLLAMCLSLPALAGSLQAGDLVAGRLPVGFQHSFHLPDAPSLQLIIPGLKPIQALLPITSIL